MRAPTLIIGYGNPSRGDDALGPAAMDAIERHMAEHPEWGQIEIATDFQLQIEFATDLAERKRIIFIDAAANGVEPFSFTPLVAKDEPSTTSHALSPAHLLAVYQRFYGTDAPPSFLLAIRGYEFELGEPLLTASQCNLDAAVTMLEHWLTVNCAQPLCHA